MEEDRARQERAVPAGWPRRPGTGRSEGGRRGASRSPSAAAAGEDDDALAALLQRTLFMSMAERAGAALIETEGRGAVTAVTTTRWTPRCRLRSILD